jgi:D-threo-aldose 1-dehydrogenase
LGINYFDTAPAYGYGLSEERLRIALGTVNREQLVISTKVGWLVQSQGDAQKRTIFQGVGERSTAPDFSRDGVLRSVEESLVRLGLDRVDILYIHDAYRFVEQAIDEAYPALEQLRSSGVVSAIGVGMGDNAILARFARECDVDCFLLWGRYSLLDQSALNELLPLCMERGIQIILGAPFESGILASDLSPGARFRYREAPEEILQLARRINAVCIRHSVPLKAAALQFVFGHPAVATVIPSTRSEERFRENFAMMSHPIPAALWGEMKAEGLLPASAPVPPPSHR